MNLSNVYLLVLADNDERAYKVYVEIEPVNLAPWSEVTSVCTSTSIALAALVDRRQRIY